MEQEGLQIYIYSDYFMNNRIITAYFTSNIIHRQYNNLILFATWFFLNQHNQNYSELIIILYNQYRSHGNGLYLYYLVPLAGLEPAHS